MSPIRLQPLLREKRYVRCSTTRQWMRPVPSVAACPDKHRSMQGIAHEAIHCADYSEDQVSHSRRESSTPSKPESCRLFIFNIPRPKCGSPFLKSTTTTYHDELWEWSACLLEESIGNEEHHHCREDILQPGFAVMKKLPAIVKIAVPRQSSSILRRQEVPNVPHLALYSNFVSLIGKPKVRNHAYKRSSFERSGTELRGRKTASPLHHVRDFCCSEGNIEKQVSSPISIATLAIR